MSEPVCQAEGKPNLCEPSLRKTAASMGYSMDGLRRSMAYNFNRLCGEMTNANAAQKEAMTALGQNIAFLLCTFDDEVEDDFNMLYEDVTVHAFGEEDYE